MGAGYTEILAGDPKADGGRRVLFYSGNDNPAKAAVAALIDKRLDATVQDVPRVGKQIDGSF